MSTTDPHIGTLNEGSLHAALKAEFARPGDRFEQRLDGFVIDIVRPGPTGDSLIEIQTGAFRAMGRKLDRLLGEYPIHLVHPIATGTWIVREGQRDRKSPKRGSLYGLFDELVSLPTILDHPHLTLEIVLSEQEAVRVPDPRARRGRGGWRTVDRRLRRIVERRVFERSTDLVALLPEDLPPVWTTADLADGASIPRRQAQAMAYCLRANELIADLGRHRDGVHYRIC